MAFLLGELGLEALTGGELAAEGATEAGSLALTESEAAAAAAAENDPALTASMQDAQDATSKVLRYNAVNADDDQMEFAKNKMYDAFKKLPNKDAARAAIKQAATDYNTKGIGNGSITPFRNWASRATQNVTNEYDVTDWSLSADEKTGAVINPTLEEMQQQEGRALGGNWVKNNPKILQETGKGGGGGGGATLDKWENQFAKMFDKTQKGAQNLVKGAKTKFANAADQVGNAFVKGAGPTVNELQTFGQNAVNTVENASAINASTGEEDIDELFGGKTQKQTIDEMFGDGKRKPRSLDAIAQSTLKTPAAEQEGEITDDIFGDGKQKQTIDDILGRRKPRSLDSLAQQLFKTPVPQMASRFGASEAEGVVDAAKSTAQDAVKSTANAVRGAARELANTARNAVQGAAEDAVKAAKEQGAAVLKDGKEAVEETSREARKKSLRHLTKLFGADQAAQFAMNSAKKDKDEVNVKSAPNINITMPQAPQVPMFPFPEVQEDRMRRYRRAETARGYFN